MSDGSLNHAFELLSDLVPRTECTIIRLLSQIHGMSRAAVLLLHSRAGLKVNLVAEGSKHVRYSLNPKSSAHSHGYMPFHSCFGTSG